MKEKDYLVDTCVEIGLYLANTFQHKMIHNYAWRRRDEHKSTIDYITVNEKLRV